MSREITPEEEAFLKAAETAWVDRGTMFDKANHFDALFVAHLALVESRKPKPAWTHSEFPTCNGEAQINYQGKFAMRIPWWLRTDLCDWLNATGKKP